MPKFSIIVPTLNRSKYLVSVLKTIIEQNFDDYEIIVADNNSNDETQSVIKNFKSNRIKYFKSDISLSRNDNWNFALSKSTGDYITFIGDDDAFFPGALKLLDQIMNRFNVDVVNWYKANYHWPDHIKNERQNIFGLKYSPIINIVKSSSKFKLFTNFKDRYGALPCIYNSLIHKKYIDKIKNLSKRNIFFEGVIPDVYSGIVLSRVIDKYAQVYFPITLNGASRLSGGVLQGERSRLISKIESDQIDDISKEALEKKYDSRIGSSTSVYSIELGEYILASKNHPDFKWPTPKWSKYISALMREISHGGTKNHSEIFEAAKFTAKQINIKFKYKRKKIRDSSKENNLYMNCNVLLSQEYIKSSYDAVNFMKILPPIDHIKTNPINFLIKEWINNSKEFAKNIMRIFLSR
jgi:glycosyltransferase involved in cell wall biosynthesis